MPLVFNQEAIDGILFTLHFQNNSPIVAHQKLMKMTGDEVMDLEQVTKFFKKIDNGDFCLKEEVEEVVVEVQKPTVTLAQILNVPNFVEKYLDIDSRLRLRKTCKTIREILDEKLLHINCFHYKCNEECIEISINEGFKVSYEIPQGGLIVTNGNREKSINTKNEEKQIEIIQRDLRSILSSEKVRFDSFGVETTVVSKSWIGMIALRNAFNQVPNKLKISKFEYCIHKVDEDFITQFIRKIDPEHLQFVKHRANYIGFNWEPNWEDFFDLEQCKRLKMLDVRFAWMFTNEIVSFFTHVENVHLEVIHKFSYKPLHNFVMELKDKLLEKPNLKQFKIRVHDKEWISEFESEFEEVKASLQQYNTSNAPWVSFPYPDSDKKLELLVEKNMIWFKGPCYVEGEWEDEINDLEEEEKEEEARDDVEEEEARDDVEEDEDKNETEEEKFKKRLYIFIGILNTLHFQKDTPIVAHQKLMEMTGEEVMDLDQVTELFKEFDNKLFSEKEVEEVVVEGEQPKVTLAQILNVPDFVEKYLDIDSRLRLRKTCKTIRKILNEKPLHIDRLNYKCNGKFIEIFTDEGFRAFYEIIEGGLKVTNGNKEKLIHTRNEEEQMEIIQRDLLSILGNGKLRIDTLKIENSEISGLFEEEPPIGMRALQNTVNRLASKLNVKKMAYLVYVVDKALIEMVKVMNPEHFQSLRFSFERYLYNCTPVWRDLYNLEQWKQLKSFNIFYPFLAVSDIVNSYTHIENAHLKIHSFYDSFYDTPIHKYVMELKDKLLKNPNLKQFKVIADKNMLDSDFEEVNASLQQFNTNNTQYPCWISIPYPYSDKKLKMLVEKKLIWFKGPCYVEGEVEEEDEHEIL